MKNAQELHSFDKNWIQDCVCQILCLNCFLKTLRKTNFFCEPWSPASFGNNQMAISDNFWTIATKNAQKPHTFDKSWIQVLKTFRKTIFFCEFWGPPNFGNNQMAHSGRLQRKMPKNLTLLTKTGFRIVFVNHSYFKLLLNTFRKIIFLCESWSSAIFGNNQMAHSGR